MTRHAAAAALVALVLAAGCSDDGGSAADDDTTTTAPDETTTTDDTVGNSSTSAAPSTTTTAPTPAPSFPPAATSLEHGGYIDAVALAGALDPNAPELIAAEAAADSAGYATGPTDGCDQGAVELLGLDPGQHWYTVSVYFDDAAAAETAAAAFEARGVAAVAGIVQTFCLD